MPIVGTVSAGVALATLVAAFYAALAVAAAVALAASSRADEVAHLSVLGLTRRQAGWLVVLEHGPTIVFSFAAGAALGLGLFAFVRPGLGLTAILGSPLEVPLTVDPLQLAFVFGSIVAVVVVGLALGTLIQGRAVPTAALRRGLEG
jgi:predicted lysophospholipase L1 biosynthesis ABC-type transport system permease subunit